MTFKDDRPMELAGWVAADEKRRIIAEAVFAIWDRDHEKTEEDFANLFGYRWERVKLALRQLSRAGQEGWE